MVAGFEDKIEEDIHKLRNADSLYSQKIKVNGFDPRASRKECSIES